MQEDIKKKDVNELRKFNEKYIQKEIERNYHNSFSDKKIKTIILHYGFRNDKTGNFTNMFFVFDPDHELIGFAIHYGVNNILRFYNHEGEDIGIEIDMIFKPLKELKKQGKFEITK